MEAVVRIESNFDPKQRTGSYVGLFQLSKYEFDRYGSGDITDASMSSSGSGSSSGGGGESPSAQYLPAISGTCPTIPPGSNGTSLTFAGEPVDIWSGTPKDGQNGPLVMFWFETFGSATDVSFQFGTAQIAAVTAAGGIVASFAKSNGMGTDTGDAVWYTGDFAMADQILACAAQQLNINTRMIYTAGCSAGGLQSGAMVFSRSDYIAASMPNSGGEVIADEYPLENAHVPSVMTAHGGSADMVVISFATASATLDTDIASRAASSKPPGGYAIDCNHGGGHCGIFFAPAVDYAAYISAQWQFCKDHPYGVAQDPYANGLPATFPSYCTVVK